ncbi:MAG TPA: efflux RND transporter periplasmic adaptor subunit, partial [Chthoniobacteraceae bacterium]|nr:efflux RND transporter periplasmic adaptor subunit [Chthoniobacteraceae bacterium]
MKILLIGFVILTLVGGGGYFASRKWPDKMPFAKDAPGSETKKFVRPTTATVSARDINFAITAAGEIVPAENVTVKSEISGRIDELPVDIGDHVKKGDLLFALDDQDLQTEKSQRLIEIEGSRLQVNASALAVEKADLNFKRTVDLHERKLVSQEVFDNTRLELDVAKNALSIAKNNFERTEKALQLVEDKLSKTKIVAPFDCTILDRKASIGQAVSGASGVNSGTDVLIIADLNELIIYAHINQADVTRMTVGQNVQIEVEAVPGLKLTGRLALIAPQATIKNGIKGFSTKIIVKNDENSGVRPGMTANLNIPLQGAEGVLAIPLAAVFTDQGDRFAYVKQNDKFERRPIRIGVTDYDFAEVTSGLQPGETVSLVTPEEEAGKAQQAFGAAARIGRGAGRGGGGEGRGGDSGQTAGRSSASPAPNAGAQGERPAG